MIEGLNLEATHVHLPDRTWQEWGIYCNGRFFRSLRFAVKLGKLVRNNYSNPGLEYYFSALQPEISQYLPFVAYDALELLDKLGLDRSQYPQIVEKARPVLQMINGLMIS